MSSEREEKLKEEATQYLIHYMSISVGSKVLVKYKANKDIFSKWAPSLKGNIEQLLERLDASNEDQRRTFATTCDYPLRDTALNIHIRQMGGVSYLLVAGGQASTSLAFQMLGAISANFRAAFGTDSQQLLAMKSSAFRGHFKHQELKGRAKPVNEEFRASHGQAPLTRVQALQQTVESTKQTMLSNVGQVVERGERLHDVEVAAEQLNEETHLLLHDAQKLKRKMWWASTKAQVCLWVCGSCMCLSILFIIGFVIYGAVCGDWTFSGNCNNGGGNNGNGNGNGGGGSTATSSTTSPLSSSTTTAPIANSTSSLPFPFS